MNKKDISYKQFIDMVRNAGSEMTVEQIAKMGEEAENKFNINKDSLMFLLLSGNKEFKEWLFNQASILYNNKINK
ncbi:hypothetical protein ACFHWD_03795 [Clostridium sp. MT-14]|uniref:hypothetical protein n=1 Tax=Clostridium sp. MT-14 TaxID=3348360 RepID=UPI0035F25C6C